jgi:NitT/TauT family transport system substrate-binding protein
MPAFERAHSCVASHREKEVVIVKHPLGAIRQARRWSAAVVTAALLFALGSAGSHADEMTTIRVATIPIDAGSQAYYAQTMGFFRSAGLNVQLTSLNNGAAVAAAVAGGAVDIGQSNAVSIAVAHEKGIPFVYIAGANRYSAKNHQAALLVSAESPLRTARDLNGKTIGISGIRGITEIGTRNWMDKNGADSKTVRFLEMPFSGMAGALEKNRVDAALLSEPELEAALNTNHFRVLADVYPAIANDFLFGGWFATTDWAKAHPDLVRAYAHAMQDAARWANGHQRESAAILDKATGIRMGPSVHRVTFADDLDPTELQPVIDLCAKYGLIKASFPASQIVLR